MTFKQKIQGLTAEAVQTEKEKEFTYDTFTMTYCDELIKIKKQITDAALKGEERIELRLSGEMQSMRDYLIQWVKSLGFTSVLAPVNDSVISIAWQACNCPSSESHTCPYSLEIDNCDELCNCCEFCEKRCGEDI